MYGQGVLRFRRGVGLGESEFARTGGMEELDKKRVEDAVKIAVVETLRDPGFSKESGLIVAPSQTF